MLSQCIKIRNLYSNLLHLMDMDILFTNSFLIYTDCNFLNECKFKLLDLDVMIKKINASEIYFMSLLTS